MTEALIVGIDPASTRLAFVAKQPLLPTVCSAKYQLGKAWSPNCAAEAMDATLDFLANLGTMSTATTPLFAFLEAPLKGPSVQATIKQCFISGVVQACLIKAGYTVYLPHPSAWKLAVCGNGRATKADVVRTVAGRWPKLGRTIGSDEDLNDAAGLAIYGGIVVARGLVVARSGVL